MHSYGIGDGCDADAIIPHFAKVAEQARNLIQPIIASQLDNDTIINTIQAIADLVRNNEVTSRYFKIWTNPSSRQNVYYGWKTIKNADLYRTSEPNSIIKKEVLSRSDTIGHAYEQMAYALAFILHCIGQPRATYKPVHWRKLLEKSQIPFRAKNALEKGVANWLVNEQDTLYKTAKLINDYERGEARIRLSPVEARIVALAGNSKDTSSQNLAEILSTGQIATGSQAIVVNLKALDGAADVTVIIDQGQTQVDLKHDKFELGHYELNLNRALPDTLADSLKGKLLEEVCDIGVFDGLKMKVRSVDWGGRIALPYAKHGIEVVLPDTVVRRHSTW